MSSKLQRVFKFNKKEQGFTILELMVVVAIIGVTAVIGVPNYLQWSSQRQLREAASRIQSQLTFARMAAMNQNATVQVALAPLGNFLTVTSINLNTGNAIFPPEQLDRHVIGFNGGPIQFSSLGLRVGGGVGPVSINIQNDRGLNYKIQVLPGGKASWCADPTAMNTVVCGPTL
jgi:prepilin-type N-terminal cleavage/methylation domain-containing protein